MAALGRLPGPGDEVVVDGPGGSWRLVVLALDGRRVHRVRVTPPDPTAIVVAQVPVAVPLEVELPVPVAATT